MFDSFSRCLSSQVQTGVDIQFWCLMFFGAASIDRDCVAWQHKLKHLFDRHSKHRQDLGANSIRYKEILLCHLPNMRRDNTPFFPYRKPVGLAEWWILRHGSANRKRWDKGVANEGREKCTRLAINQCSALKFLFHIGKLSSTATLWAIQCHLQIKLNTLGLCYWNASCSTSSHMAHVIWCALGGVFEHLLAASQITTTCEQWLEVFTTVTRHNPWTLDWNGTVLCHGWEIMWHHHIDLHGPLSNWLICLIIYGAEGLIPPIIFLDKYPSLVIESHINPIPSHSKMSKIMGKYPSLQSESSSIISHPILPCPGMVWIMTMIG